jgi:PAS domain S-box-containing protein
MKSVFAKLALLQLAGGLLGISILYLLMDSQLSRGMNENYVTHGQVVAQTLAKAVEPGLINHDLTSVQSSLDAMLTSPNVEWVCVTAPDGQILAHTLVPRFPEALSIAEISNQKHGAVITMPGTKKSVTVFTQPVLTGIVGEVHVAFGRQDLVSSIHRMEWLILAGIAGVMLVVTLGFAVLAHRIVAPIRILTDAALLLGGAQRASFKAVPVRSNDEVGILTKAFNSMVLEIQSHEELLETRVRERTDDLVQANHDLAGEVAERTRMEGALKVANRNLSELIKASPVAITAYDLQGNVQSWNPAAERLFGWTEHEVIGRALPFIPQNKQAEFHDRLHRVVLRGDDLSGEGVRRVKKDGSPVELSISSAALRDASGSTVGLISVIADITERNRVEEERQKARAAAEAANRAKSEFLANMSHEIRTPMNGVIGMTDLALETDLTLQQREYLGMVKSSAGVLMAVINDILDFSKIEAGKLDLDAIEFRIRDTVDDIVRLMALHAHQKGLELVAEIQPGVPDVLVGDPVRLQQVLLNLVGNAIKFTDKGKIFLRVQPGDSVPGSLSLHFSVQDTGIGIPADRQQLIFEPFTQADNSTTRKYGGTGLGLSITSRLVALMGGRIWVESAPDSGSVFHFTGAFSLGRHNVLPLIACPSTDVRIPSAMANSSGQIARPLSTASASPREGRPGRRILLVEDNVVNQVLARRLLERQGHTVVVANNGLEALAFLQEQSFDIALMDVQMPEMDGLAATRALRAKECVSGKHLPIIALTAHAMKGDEERCLDAGMDGYISKPIQKTELFSLIHRLAPSGSCLDAIPSIA